MGTSSVGWAGSSGFLWRILSLVKKTLLCVCYLENHVFLDPEIERTIAARDVFLSVMHNCEPLPVVHHQK